MSEAYMPSCSAFQPLCPPLDKEKDPFVSFLE
ncbi:MAG: hypothetical protein K0S36_1887 [Nitrosospira multiformis]|nr:hypothetical protein [Nitrosospira multiformis]